MDFTHMEARQFIRHPVNLPIEACQLAAEAYCLGTDKPHCPHCAHEQVSRWGFANGLQRYRCNACRATFNALTDTLLAGPRHKVKWMDYAKQLAEGTSFRKSAAAQ